MRLRISALAGAFALLLTAECAPGPAVPAEAAGSSVRVVRYGPGRLAPAYREREPAAKAILFRRINEERAAAGVPTLSYSLLGAEVGDAFCLDAAEKGSVGHYDTRGRAPYLRWAQAGGVDYHAQNFAAQRQVGEPIAEPMAELLLDAHARMMAERPPDDGHRRTVLDPTLTHVGLGCALLGGEFRMTEEYVREVMEWIEVPAGPLPVGGRAPFAARVKPGYTLGAVEVAWEAEPKPLSLREISLRTEYRYPPSVRTLRPLLSEGFRWAEGGRGDFALGPSGRFDLFVPLDSGPGSYYVLAFVWKGPASKDSMRQVTAARIVAR